jgi:hypothetical protein
MIAAAEEALARTEATVAPPRDLPPPPPHRASPSSRVSRARASVQRQTGVFTALGKPAGVGAAVSILAALFIFWLARRQFGNDGTADGAPAAIVAPTNGAVSGPAGGTVPSDPNIVDPADSGGVVYAVQITQANTQAGAILKVQEDSPSMPAATFAPVEVQGGVTWYKVLAGAFMTRGGADSLLSALRTGGQLDSLSGVVVRVPYAVRIDSIRKSSTVAEHLRGLRDGRRLPAYALEQDNGWLWVMVGAFETRSQADSYAEKLRADGYPAELTIRKGRMF